MNEQHLDGRGIVLGIGGSIVCMALGVYSLFNDRQNPNLANIISPTLSVPTQELTRCQNINKKNATASQVLAKLRKETGFKGNKVIFCNNKCKPINTDKLPVLVRTGNKICLP